MGFLPWVHTEGVAGLLQACHPGANPKPFGEVYCDKVRKAKLEEGKTVRFEGGCEEKCKSGIKSHSGEK